jgi:hypothetical protein
VPDLAAIDDVTGRDIRRAVIDAATSVALGGRDWATQDDLRSAIEQIKAHRISRAKRTPVEPDSELEQAITEAVERDLPLLQQEEAQC